MINLKLTPKEAKETMLCGPCDPEGPAYPYGLTLELSDEVLEKLGVKDLPGVGAEILLTAKAKVTSVSINERQDADGDKEADKRRSVGLQITDLDVPALTAKTGFYGKG
jgi:hypothetical protein